MADINYAISGQITKGALTQSFGGSGITATIATAGLLSVTLNLGTSVTEINVTSPTCFQEIFDQTGCDVASIFIDALEAAVQAA